MAAIDPMIQQIVSAIVPPAASAGLVVILGRLLINGWLKDQQAFRERVEKHITDTGTYPDFRIRTEDRLREVADLKTKVNGLGYEAAALRSELQTLRVDVKEGIRDLKTEIDKMSEKLDDIFRRAFGPGRREGDIG